MLDLSFYTIFAIYQRHLSKDKTKAEARGHAAALLVISGRVPDRTTAHRYVRALFP